MYKLITLILVSVVLLSCTLLPVQQPTATPTITNTIEPTSTTAPTATETALPTGEVTSPGLENFSSLVVVEGFTISVPFPLFHQVNNNVIVIGDEANTLTASFASDVYGSDDTTEGVMNDYLGSLERRGWEFTKGEPVEVEIGTATGITLDLTGTFQGLNFEGQAVTVTLRSDLVMFALGLSQVSADPNRWKDSGKETFTTLLDSIEFIDAASTCPISTDETYGYSEDNPIRVGGDFISGVSRERAYLNHLRGPNGESLSYERDGSLSHGDTILDIYNITGSGIDEILYVDLYNYSELQAPVGFTCEGPFPLSAP